MKGMLAGRSLHRRFADRGKELKFAFADKCCGAFLLFEIFLLYVVCEGDAKWLQKQFPDIHIMIDIHHLIMRYYESAPKDNIHEVSAFIKQLSKILVDALNSKTAQNGRSIHSSITQLLERIKVKERGMSNDKKVVTTKLERCHQAQLDHFISCLPRQDFDGSVHD